MHVNNIEIEDRILLKRAACHGCSESLAAVYLKYQPIICDFLIKSGAGNMAEDICQSVFLQLREGKCNYDGSSEVKNYLFAVAGNIFKNKGSQNKDLRAVTCKSRRRLAYRAKYPGLPTGNPASR